MSGTNWTPGPWHVELERGGADPEADICWVSVEDAKGDYIWMCVGEASDEIIANAHVTAGALDLYDICEEYKEELGAALAMSYMAELPTEAFDDLNARLKRVSAALKKARGEQ
jgi:hypothetical protein